MSIFVLTAQAIPASLPDQVSFPDHVCREIKVLLVSEIFVQDIMTGSTEATSLLSNTV